LERGELGVDEFEAMLAGRLRRWDGAPVPAPGLLREMFDDVPLDEELLRLVARIRDSGVRTVLVSNAWGSAYPRERLAGSISDWVLSNEVGVRKPEPEIYRYAARRAGCDVANCVFVDDRASNVESAVAVGMIGLHFTDRAAARSRIRELFLAGPGTAVEVTRERDR
jgi:FMN phosphatase YigB (HAD superfamily)